MIINLQILVSMDESGDKIYIYLNILFVIYNNKKKEDNA